MSAIENTLATEAVDIAYYIHKKLGPGLLEKVYESAFASELRKRGIAYTRQEKIPVHFNDELLDVAFRADIIMEQKLLIELKSVANIEKVHHKTVITYLKFADLRLGLLINFHVNLIKDGIHRKILGNLER
jgi:GxxExxY protein